MFGSGIAAYAAPSALAGCTYDQYGRQVDGSSLWVAATGPGQPPDVETNCQIDQLAYNNFLHLVSDDGKGHPKFMSMAPWYKLLPATGAPVWSGNYTPLSGTRLHKTGNRIQAGDGFELLDVDKQVTSYDMRVNQVFFDYVQSNNVYMQKAMNQLATEFNVNSYRYGVWLPASSAQNGPGAIEIKTSWRNLSLIHI